MTTLALGASACDAPSNAESGGGTAGDTGATGGNCDPDTGCDPTWADTFTTGITTWGTSTHGGGSSASGTTGWHEVTTSTGPEETGGVGSADTTGVDATSTATTSTDTTSEDATGVDDTSDETGAVCPSGQRYCSEGKIYQCRGDGSGAVLVEDCGGEALCDADSATCLEVICEPDTPVCDGSVATLCNQLGTGFEPGGTDCATLPDDRSCVNGSCKAQLCPAKARVCVDGHSHICADDGQSTMLVENCEDNQYCDTASGQCATQVCMPGSAVCDKDGKATQCNAEGSGMVPGGRDCASEGMVCALGACVDTTCVPNERFCREGAIHRCNADGSGSAIERACLDRTFCDEQTLDCLPHLCFPGAVMCDRQRATQCKSDGSGLDPGGIDCAARGEQCVVGSCLPVADTWRDTFDDGDASDWVFTEGKDPGATFEVVASNAAQGSSAGLGLVSEVGSRPVTTLGRTLPTVGHPKSLSVWMRSDDTNSGHSWCSLRGMVGDELQSIIAVGIQDGNKARTGAYNARSFDVSPGVWHLLEAVNIDWSERHFDFRVNGELVDTEVDFLRSEGDAIEDVLLYHNDAGGTRATKQSAFDELVISY